MIGFKISQFWLLIHIFKTKQYKNNYFNWTSKYGESYFHSAPTSPSGQVLLPSPYLWNKKNPDRFYWSDRDIEKYRKVKNSGFKFGNFDSRYASFKQKTACSAHKLRGRTDTFRKSFLFSSWSRIYIHVYTYLDYFSNCTPIFKN